jgi:hypothetical protein
MMQSPDAIRTRERGLMSLRHREEQSDEAIQSRRVSLDCVASLAMTTEQVGGSSQLSCTATQPHSASTACTKLSGSAQNSRRALK